MKVCPKCREVYKDEDLNFCLADGAALKGATRLMPRHSHFEQALGRLLRAMPWISLFSFVLTIGGCAACMSSQESAFVAYDGKHANPELMLWSSTIAGAGLLLFIASSLVAAVTHDNRSWFDSLDFSDNPGARVWITFATLSFVIALGSCVRVMSDSQPSYVRHSNPFFFWLTALAFASFVVCTVKVIRKY